MMQKEGRDNGESLFGLRQIPCDYQIRALLDPVSPEPLSPVYWDIFQQLEGEGIIENYRWFQRQLLLALDGTHYFSSPEIHYQNCNHRQPVNGGVQYFHAAITPVLVKPGESCVIELEPEFILPQDGQEKQDCERQAAKR